MTEQSKTPARIWADMNIGIWLGKAQPERRPEPPVEFIRADLVEPLVEALRAAIRVADEAREEWDKATSGMKAGKLLIALSEPSLKYRADITAIHAALQAYEAAQSGQAQTEARHDES